MPQAYGWPPARGLSGRIPGSGASPQHLLVPYDHAHDLVLLPNDARADILPRGDVLERAVPPEALEKERAAGAFRIKPVKLPIPVLRGFPDREAVDILLREDREPAIILCFAIA